MPEGPQAASREPGVIAPLGRRACLAGVAAAAIAPAAAQRPLVHAAAALTPYAFGAVGDGITDDTDALQAAVDAAIRTGSPLDLPPGCFKLVPKTPVRYLNLTESTETRVYAAVRIGGSGLTLRGRGGRFLLGDPEGGAPALAPGAGGLLAYMFTTDKNLQRGAVTDLAFDGVVIDFCALRFSIPAGFPNAWGTVAAGRSGRARRAGTEAWLPFTVRHVEPRCQLLFCAWDSAAPGQRIPPGTRNIEVELQDEDGHGSGARALAPLADGYGFPNPRGIAAVGVRRFVVRGCWLGSTGERNGSGINLQNCDEVVFDDCDFRDITQGTNWSYVTGWRLDRCRFSNFREAIDFDRVVRHGSARGNRFANLGRRGQAWDLNSVTDALIEDTEAEGVLSVFNPSWKPTTAPDFLTAVTLDHHRYASPPDRHVNSEDVVIRGLRARNCGTINVPFLQVAFERPNRNPAPYLGKPPPRRVTFEAVEAEDCGPVHVWEASELVLRRMVLLRSLAGTDSNRAALVLRRETETDSALTGLVEDVTIEGSGGNGVLAVGPGQLTLRRLRVLGHGEGGGSPSTGLWLRELGDDARLLLDEVTLRGGVDPAAVGLRLHSAAGATQGEVAFGRGRLQIAAPRPLVFASGTAQRLIRPTRRVALAGGTAPIVVTLAAPLVGRLRVLGITLRAEQPMAAGAPTLLRVVRRRAGALAPVGATLAFRDALAGGEEVDLALAQLRDETDLGLGDELVLVVERADQALPPMTAFVSEIAYQDG